MLMKTICSLIVVSLLLPVQSVFASGKVVAINTVSLDNPLNNITSINGLLVAILNIVEILMVPVIVFFIILAGFKYVTAQGNSTKVG